jgi:hypothetical protein
MPLTDEERSLLKRIYQRLEGNTPLKPGDKDYLELYQPIYGRPGCEDPVELMQLHIEMSSVESIQLFSGFRGAGKTTELFRLKSQLESEPCVVLYADALEYIGQSDEVDIVTLLVALAGAFSDSLKNEMQVDLIGESYWARFTNFLSKFNVDISQLGIGVGVEVKMALNSSPSFRQRLEQALSSRVFELKNHVDKFVEDGVKAICKARGDDAQIVFLFDSLEQVRGSRSNEQAVIRSVERLFADNYPKMFKLPNVHAVYTVPPWLQFSAPGITQSNINIIPAVRCWNNDMERSECREGCDALYSLIKRRFGDAGFKRCFGDETGDYNVLAKKAIDASGGHFRDLLTLLREALLRAKSLPMTEEVIDAAISAVRRRFLPIAIDDARWLYQISQLRSTELPGTDAESVSRLTRFLDTHFVLYFKNGGEWYDIHPLIRDEVEAIVRRHGEATAAGVPVASDITLVPTE